MFERYSIKDSKLLNRRYDMSANSELRNFGGTANYMLRPNTGRGIFVVRVFKQVGFHISERRGIHGFI